MSYQKEFLQIPEGQIADVSFKFPTGLQKNGQYGPYFLYTIVHDGKEKFLKVTERLEKELRKMNIKTKQAYSLFKETIHPKNGEPLTVIRIVEKQKSTTRIKSSTTAIAGKSASTSKGAGVQFHR